MRHITTPVGSLWSVRSMSSWNSRCASCSTTFAWWQSPPILTKSETKHQFTHQKPSCQAVHDIYNIRISIALPTLWVIQLIPSRCYSVDQLFLVGLFARVQGCQPPWRSELTWWARSNMIRNVCQSHKPRIVVLLVVSTHLKNISQIGSFPQIGMKIKYIYLKHFETII